MRHFIQRLLVFFALQSLIGAACLFVYFKTAHSDQHFMAASRDKDRLLRQQPPPRLVFVGGSGTAFSLDCEELERRLGRHPINMGLHAGLGLNLMLHQVRAALQPGDVIVVTPEYTHFDSTFNGIGEILVYLLEYHPGSIKYFAAGNIKYLLDDGLVRFGSIVRYSINRLRGTSQLNPFTEGIYRRDAFNRYGDAVRHHGAPRPKFVETMDRFTVSESGLDRAIDGLNEFHAFCQRKGARVFFAHPAIPREFYSKNSLAIGRIHAVLKQRLKFPLLDTPEEMAYPFELFFDTKYHLTHEGTARRTRHLAERLGPHLTAR